MQSINNYREQKELVDVYYYRLAQIADQMNELQNERDRVAKKHLEAVHHLITLKPIERPNSV